MKTITLRTLVREPLKVKKMTRAGNAVQVTDHGEPLWILSPANGTSEGEAERHRAVEEMFEEMLREKPSKFSAARILEESRR